MRYEERFASIDLIRVALTCAAASFASGASAVGPAATIFYAVDGGTPVDVVAPGVTVFPSGNQSYTGTWNSGNGAWNATYSVSVDFNANPTSTLSGLIVFQNTSAASHSFEFGVDVPLCPAITGGTLIGGSAVLTLNSVGAGAVTCFNNTPVIQAMIDGSQAAAIFNCPMNIGTTGSGTATSFDNFGTPIPSMVGPVTISSVGQREQFTVTAGDKVTISFAFTFTSDGSASACEFDLDGNGDVDSGDLAIVLSQWGQTSTCLYGLVGDLDHNGVVGSSDLTWLLEAWGDCR